MGTSAPARHVDAASRRLPWDRVIGEDAELTELLRVFAARWPDADAELIKSAFDCAREAHDGQSRRTGEAYIHHPLAVAIVVAELGLDDVSIAASLLHDAVEDTGVTLEDVNLGFGSEVAGIVDGVTKLERVSFNSKEAQQAATMRKMLVAMANDMRVLIIKLSDRLHNMRTIAVMRPEQQVRIATETLEIYAPLAHRLGMQEVKMQLEDLAFAAKYPRRFAEIEHMVNQRAPERTKHAELVVGELESRLDELGIQALVGGRRKHLWSIYEKMVVKGRDFSEIHDLMAVRVIVSSVRDCYAALGCIHSAWRPVQGRFKDYVAMPKFNLYQSLHTTVVGPGGRVLEVQIRTREMHQRAEYGIAAHWQYKSKVDATEVPWLDRIVDWESEVSDPEEFMAMLKVDLEQDEVFVFTPKGDVVTLSMGATPVDFAYSIHTEVGDSCIGARVDGRLVPLDSKLRSGDSVEVFTSKVTGSGPSRDWLLQVSTPRARNKIRQWFARERRDDAIDAGRDELLKALRREGLPVQKLISSDSLLKLGEAHNYQDLDSLYAAVGEHHLSAQSIAQQLSRELSQGGAEEQLPERVEQRSRPASTRQASVHVEGLDDVLVRLAKCCTPVPGDDIMGFVTRGRGVSVHRTDCANGASLSEGQTDRLIDVEWDAEGGGTFVATLEVKALDRAALLSEVTKILSEHHVNILSSSTSTGSDRICTMAFEFELGDPSHLEALIPALRHIESVYDVYRVLPGSGPRAAVREH